MADIILYDPNSGRKLNTGESVTFQGKTYTQGQPLSSVTATPAVSTATVTPKTSSTLSQAQLDAISAQVSAISNKTKEIAAAVPTAISASSLQKTETPVTLPEKKADTTNYSGITAGAKSSIDTYTQNMKDLLASYTQNAPEPTDTASIYDQLAEQYGITAKQTAVNDAQAAVNTANNELNNINAQIQAVTDQAAAANLQLESNAGTGSDITSTFLGRQQTEINRQAAIKSLPLQSSALVASAKVSAAQGNAELAQNQLTQAQDTVTKLYSIQSDNAKTNYEYKMNLYNSVFEMATDLQKTQLEALQKEEAQNFTVLQNNLNYAQDLAKAAIESVQGSLASAITSLDPNTSDYMTRLGELAGQIKVATKASSTSIVNTNGHSYLIDDTTGKTIKDLGVANSEISSGGNGGTEGQQLRTAVTSMAQQLETRKGNDGYISPEDYKKAKAAWVSEAGYSSKDFDEQFSYLSNPSHLQDYGISRDI